MSNGFMAQRRVLRKRGLLRMLPFESAATRLRVVVQKVLDLRRKIHGMSVKSAKLPETEEPRRIET